MIYNDFESMISKGLLSWHEEDNSYHDASGHRYATDGEELINAELDDNFKDVARIRERENPRFNRFTGKVE